MARSSSHSYEIDMVHGPLAGKLLLFALPLMLSSILQLLFNAADIIVVGQFASPNSVAAVGSTSSIINLIVAVFMGLGVGVNVSVAHYHAIRQDRETEETVHTAAFIGMAGGVLLLVFGVLVTRPVLILMGSPDDVIHLATMYMRIYFLGMPANLFYNMGSAVLRAVGDTRRPLVYLMIAGVLNVLLNLMFVIGFNMDVAGVALATILSQLVSALLVLRCLMRSTDSYRLELRKIRIVRDKFLRILRIGLPAGIQSAVFSISNVLIQASVNSFGSAVMAGNAAAANIEGFVYVSMNAFHQACVTFTSQNFGAREYKRVYRILWQCLVMVVITGLLLGNLAHFFGQQLLSIYITPESNAPEQLAAAKDAVATGMERLLIISVPYFLCGIMEVICGTLRGIGMSITPMVVSIIGACGLRILWIATVFRRYHEMRVLYLSYPVSWTITAAVHFLCFFLFFSSRARKV